MIRTILIPVLVGTCAFFARAVDVYSPEVGRAVESSQDFEGFEPDAEDVHRELESGFSFWSAPADQTLVSSVVREDADGVRYLDVNASERPGEGLMRLFVPRASFTDAVTNASTSVVGGYADLYSAFRTKFELYEADVVPECDFGDRLVLWAQKDPADENAPGTLFLSAGRFVGNMRNPVRCDYRIATSGIDPDAWHEVTIRMIPDISVGVYALGFEVWIDGNPAVCADDYSVADFDIGDYLTAEAKALIDSRRLFPSLTVPGLNTSVAVGGVSFTGIGSVDDLSFTTNAPTEWAKGPRAFTLRWDAGVTAIAYRIGEGDAITVPSAAIAGRCAFFEIPRESVGITVTAEYNSAEDYSQGIWTAEGACSVVTNIEGAVTNYSFRCDASSATGTGYVRSFRKEIVLGGGIGAYASFADAKRQALAQGAVLVLNGDFAASRDTEDEGLIMVDRGETLTIDLNGHSLTNAVGEFPTVVNYGKLTIIDSQGGGKVVPYAPYVGDTNALRQTAVQNYASYKILPELRICGGIYDGYIKNSGVVTNHGSAARMEGVFVIVRNEFSQDDPQFLEAEADAFPYERYLEDKTLYYSYEEPYWQPLTNAFIWCGKGADDKWSNPANWRCNAVPGADDYAIFPAAGTNLWEADMETGIAVKDIWFAGNVILHGSADFTKVKWKIPAKGRVLGDAVLTWRGKLPPDLSTLLDPRWAGAVVIDNVGNTSPNLMSDLATWGTGSSKVVFQGVRGYYHMTGTVTVPYVLELVDGPNGYAWKNDAGFTGGIIDIPVLTGSGTFVSPKNTIANRQVIVFRDVMSFTGTMDVQGKRVVLGSGDAATLEAGSITWSDGAKIKAGFVPSCRVAAFGGSMDFAGSYDAEIAVYSGFTVGDPSEVVNMSLLPGEVGELCVTNPVGVVKVVVWSDDAIIVDGRRVDTNDLTTATSTTSIKAKKGAAKKLSFAKYYDAEELEDESGMVTVKLTLNELAVPVIGATGDERAKITFADGMASVIISNVIDGFWYGLEYKPTLSDPWPSEPYVWTVANPLEGGLAELIAPAEGPSGFYRVVVSDVDPTGEEEK